jgi:hypothetical protein
MKNSKKYKKRSKQSKPLKRRTRRGGNLTAEEEPDINPDLVVGPLPPPEMYLEHLGRHLNYYSNVFSVSRSVKNDTIIEAFNHLFHDNCVVKIVKRGILKLVTVDMHEVSPSYLTFIDTIDDLQRGQKIRLYKDHGNWLYDPLQFHADGRPFNRDDLTIDPAHPESFYVKLFV